MVVRRVVQKQLCWADINNQLELPTYSLWAFPGIEEANVVRFTAVDTLQNEWNLKLYIRRSNRHNYLSPVVRGEWLRFVSENGLKVGDKLILTRDVDEVNGVCYNIKAQRRMCNVWLHIARTTTKDLQQEEIAPGKTMATLSDHRGFQGSKVTIGDTGHLVGKAMPSPSPPVPRVIAKPESTPMKDQWRKGKLIGRGTFGSVYVASNRETGALCAIKEVEICPDDSKSAESIKQLEQEIKVLSQLKHPNIVQYYGSEIDDGWLSIYLEYVHPGSINKYLQEHCGARTESVVRSFTRHVLSGLAYLHGTKTIHRDIKGANLLVNASGVVKLADFGMAKHLTGQATNLSSKGSPYWMAPELIDTGMQKDTSFDLALAVDIWSLGCTIIEMFNGKPPWSECEWQAAMFKVLRGTPPIPQTLSREGKDFLRCCFRRNPAKRPSACILLKHRWLKKSPTTCRRMFNPIN